MDWQKQQIFPHAGMAITPQPEAIQDGQASDMLNLRFDKLGYLVNRNGVRLLDVDEVMVPHAPFLTDVVKGAVGLGEYILSAPVTDEATFHYDADITKTGKVRTSDHGTGAAIPYTQFDRFMVLAFRNSTNGLVYYAIPLTALPDTVPADTEIRPGHTTQEFPLTWRVSITATTNDIVFFARPEQADGKQGGTMVAPSRRLVRSSDDKWVNATTGTVDDENWIEHYQSFNQFANMLVICDRVNGDKLLRDDYDDALPGETPKHHLRLQENALAFFDVDTVRVDPRLGSGEENGDGVDHGLALYKLYLPQIETKAVEDGYTGAFTALVGQDIDVNQSANACVYDGTPYPALDFAAMWNKTRGRSHTFFSGYALDLHDKTDNVTYSPILQSVMARKGGRYTYSTEKQSSTVSSLLGTPSFHNPDLEQEYDDKGNLVNNDAADVFVWNDVRMTYYPASGIEEGEIYLRGADREFAKTTAIAPKIVKTTTRTGVAQEIPLGVWAYRFVWDMGNAEYSVPSAPLLVPDKLWSVLQDTDMISYERMKKYSGTGAETGAQGFSSAAGAVDPWLTDPADRYTGLVSTIKNKLYSSGHLFNSADRGLRQTLITVHHHEDQIELQGVILHGLRGEIAMECDDPCPDTDSKIAHESRWKDSVSVQIQVPLTKSVGVNPTYNSFFCDTDETAQHGAMRWAVPGRGVGEVNLQYELVFEGENAFAPWYNVHTQTPSKTVIFGLTGYCLTESAEKWWQFPSAVWSKCDPDVFLGSPTYPQCDRLEVITDAKSITYNLVRSETATGHDNNNNTRVNIASVLRFVNNEDHRLLNLRDSVPLEVQDRLLVGGMAEFILADNSSEGVAVSQYWHVIDGITPADYTDAAHSRSWSYNSGGDINRTPTTNQGKVVQPLYDVYQTALVGGVMASNDFTIFGNNTVKYVTHPTAPETKHYEDNTFNNLTIAMYLPGERLLLPEQLTAYFPSSLLFKSPRMMLKIAGVDIPTRARKLMIFRTLASHDNDWQPDNFGLVDSITVERNVDGTAKEFTYFDEKKDEDIDFTQTPNQYDGFVHPLKSRFSAIMQERVWFANFIETTQPYAARAFVRNDFDRKVPPYEPQTTVHPDALMPNSGATFSFTAGWKELVVTDDQTHRDKGYTNTLNGKELRYFIVFKDLTGAYSGLKSAVVGASDPNPATGHICYVDFSSVGAGQLSAVALFLAGYPYTASLTTCEVYRSIDNGQYYKIGEIKAEDEGVFVDTGLENKSLWTTYDPNLVQLPISEPDITTNPSAIRYSEVGQPFNLKYENIEPVRQGDGDQITGMVVQSSGDLVTFKERSMVRLMTGGTSEIRRRDQVSDHYGCIAPNACIAYNYQIYFLSWHGLIKYDNDTFRKADGAFAYELDRRLREEVEGRRNPALRDASLAINPVHRELYLNIPAYGGDGTYNIEEKGVKGHIYVINLDTDLCTKFQYETGDVERFVPGQVDGTSTRGTWQRSLGKIYHTNSLGQLWSADILPKNDGLSTYFYLEAPTSRDYDEYQPGIKSDGTGDQETTTMIVNSLIQTWWRSKSFMFGDSSVSKRIRALYTKMTAGNNIRVTMEVDNSEYGVQRSNGGYGATGELTYIPPFEGGYDRGEFITFEIASKGTTEERTTSVLWRPVNPFAR